jgi:hypothetical protein
MALLVLGWLALTAGPVVAQEQPKPGSALSLLGNYFLLDVVRKDLRGFQSTPELYFWNAWLGR